MISRSLDCIKQVGELFQIVGGGIGSLEEFDKFLDGWRKVY